MPLIMSAKAKRFMQMSSRASQFATRVQQIEQEAADVATAESRTVYQRWHSGRPNPPARKGRATTGGTFADLLIWNRKSNGMIEFDMAALRSRTPTNTGNFSYALIQEIGTGQSARILGSQSGAVAVPSQRGRRISPSLMWSDGGGGNSRPMTAKNRLAAQKSGTFGMQNLFERPQGTFGRAGLIRREIRGKHFIRDGGVVGWDLLQERLVKDFKRTFK